MGLIPHNFVSTKSGLDQIQVDWTSMLEKSYYQSEETLKELSSVIANLLKILKIEDSMTKADRVVNLEKRIAFEAMPTTEELFSRWNVEKFWSRNEFIKDYPYLSQQIAAKSFPLKVPVHQYLVPLYKFVEKTLAETDLQTLRDFLLVRLLIEKIDFSQPEWETQYRKFKNTRLGSPANRRPLDQECSRLVQSKLGRLLAAEMTTKFFKDFPKNDFNELVESIRQSLLKEINGNQWLSSQGRKNALKKVRAMRMALLFPENENDWRFPPLVKLQSKGFLENLKLINHAYYMRTLSEIKNPRNINAWSMSPLEFEAYYMWSENRFYFPAAFVSKPVFDADRKKTENLAGIGTLIAHELGHALDKYGSQYNELGVKKSIFTKKDQKKFEKLSSGFIEQFNQIGHNGEQTLAENLADHVGLRTAYQAAFSQNKDATQQKEFFITYARQWCTSMSEEYRASHLKEDTHALPEARVNEQLKHLPEFADAFQCPSGARMVLPEGKRLRVW